MTSKQRGTRLARLEKAFAPAQSDEVTLEELCRLFWHLDRKAFEKIAAGSQLSLFAVQFRRTDENRKSRKFR